MITPGPALTIAAPPSPPTRACEELVGSPSRHVIKSHATAPNRAAKMTELSMRLTSTRPPPTVRATAVPNVKAATKLKNAAHMTPCSGVRTRVDTTVAMELAAS